MKWFGKQQELKSGEVIELVKNIDKLADCIKAISERQDQQYKFIEAIAKIQPKQTNLIEKLAGIILKNNGSSDDLVVILKAVKDLNESIKEARDSLK